jgi:hypothetical protein
MSVTAEEVEMWKNLDIASLCTTIPTLIQWIVLLRRMLIQKNRSTFFALIVIAIMMIVT